jgi:hypothetical protein
MIRSGTLAVFIFVSVLVLSACGGTTTDRVTSARQEIEKVLHMANTGTDPSVVCKRIATQRYDEQLTQTEGFAAVAECERQVASSSGASAAASRIEVDGRRATVDLAVEGGPYDGQTLRMELLQLDGQWKFNEITEFIGLHRLRLLKTIFVSFPKEAHQLPHAVVRCVLEELAKSSQETIERILLSGSLEPWRSLVGRCSQGDSLAIA